MWTGLKPEQHQKPWRAEWKVILTIFANHTGELLLAWKNTYRGWEAGRERKNSYIFNLTNIGNLLEGNIFLFSEPNFLRKKKNMYTQISQ